MKITTTPIEKQVPNIETCKKLQEVLRKFDFRLDTHLYHFFIVRKCNNLTAHRIDDIFKYDTYTLDETKEVSKPTPAPLFTELWGLLPEKIKIEGGVDLTIKQLALSDCGYIGLINFSQRNLAQASAELVIWIAENYPKQFKKHLEEI